MKKLSLLSFSFITHFSVVIIALIAATVMGWFAVNRMLVVETQRTLERTLPIFSERLTAKDASATEATIDDLCKKLYNDTGYRFTVMDANGVVLGDGKGIPRQMRNHAGRPEFRMAISTGLGSDRRVSDSIHREMLYTARKLLINDSRTLVVRVAVDVELMRQPLLELWQKWRGIGMLLLAAAAGLSILMARFIAQPLSIIRQRVSSFENGRFDRPVPHSRIKDLDRLADDLNRMARRLDDRIKTVERQRDEEDALFSCMVEGVVAVDKDKNILRINRSAAKLLGVSGQAPVEGRSVLSLTRNPEWLNLLERVLGGESPVEGFVELNGGSKVLQAHAAALMGPENQRLGALLVFNDVTELSRVETMQRDFVANVSHELKTPITSIKGFAETMLESDTDDEETRRRFLNIILKQANRLQSIVTDILSLAALENGMRSPDPEIENVNLDEMLENALLPCRNVAAAHGVKLEIECSVKEKVKLYSFFMEQAVTNLVDNAIKFSPPEGTVHISAETRDGEIVISVRDNGPGIAGEHHERLWERFYRVDRGRSRRLGGTGLGLAIVRRVALLHGGRSEVESTPGAGSTFRIVIPLRQSRAA